jgi:hypothetical protein
MEVVVSTISDKDETRLTSHHVTGLWTQVD